VIERDLMLVEMVWFCADAGAASGFLPAHHDHPTVPLADRRAGRCGQSLMVCARSMTGANVSA